MNLKEFKIKKNSLKYTFASLAFFVVVLKVVVLLVLTCFFLEFILLLYKLTHTRIYSLTSLFADAILHSHLHIISLILILYMFLNFVQHIRTFVHHLTVIAAAVLCDRRRAIVIRMECDMDAATTCGAAAIVIVTT